eukprot:15344205-Ditylum_brightwellii.AAC.1
MTTQAAVDTSLEAVRESLAKLIVDKPKVDGHADAETLRTTQAAVDTSLEAVGEPLANWIVDQEFEETFREAKESEKQQAANVKMNNQQERIKHLLNRRKDALTDTKQKAEDVIFQIADLETKKNDNMRIFLQKTKEGSSPEVNLE